MTPRKNEGRRRDQGRPGMYETWGDFWKALGVAALCWVALYLVVIVVAAQ